MVIIGWCFVFLLCPPLCFTVFCVCVSSSVSISLKNSSLFFDNSTFFQASFYHLMNNVHWTQRLYIAMEFYEPQIDNKLLSAFSQIINHPILWAFFCRSVPLLLLLVVQCVFHSALSIHSFILSFSRIAFDQIVFHVDHTHSSCFLLQSPLSDYNCFIDKNRTALCCLSYIRTTINQD